MAAFQPADVREAADIVRQAAAEGRRLEIRGGGSKAAYGAGPAADIDIDILDTGRLVAIVDYDPQELVLTAQAGARLSDIEPLLAGNRQMLAFEPPRLNALLGSAAEPTLGGILAANLAGPRRLSAGAARDHFLGFEAVSGRGLAFKAGGRVVKNVAGFDLPKLMAGAWGALAALTTVTVKVVPRPRTAATVVLVELSDARAVQAMTAALRLPAEVSGAAHLPQMDGQAVTALRVEGFAPSVAVRVERLKSTLKGFGEIVVLDEADTTELWASVREVAPLAARPGALWRLSLPPTHGARATAALAGDGARWIYDWAGGLVWLSLAEPRAARVRAVAGELGGHATLVRSDRTAGAPAFHPEAPAVAALTARVRTAFDPQGVFADRRGLGSLGSGA
ncbi:glycolate oxidase subunit GlcE [Phenylobacterium sp.]|jgi:glycolate oxidase FAD binding subunit|uniref:glycolate oxidase subunit GlcE n=1 Tax=Phenylobacterium sp. TaxID=1871053 RepID=UPI002F411289